MQFSREWVCIFACGGPGGRAYCRIARSPTVLWQHSPIAASPIARVVYRPQSYSPTDLTPYRSLDLSSISPIALSPSVLWPDWPIAIGPYRQSVLWPYRHQSYGRIDLSPFGPYRQSVLWPDWPIAIRGLSPISPMARLTYRHQRPIAHQFYMARLTYRHQAYGPTDLWVSGYIDQSYP